MFEKQEIVNITKEELISKITPLSKEGYRLVQICCTKLDRLIVDYTFDKEYKFYGLRVELPLVNAELPSITDIYFAAFAYENELHDLYGIKVIGNKVDFGGKFYRINEKTPFNKQEEVKNG